MNAIPDEYCEQIYVSIDGPRNKHDSQEIMKIVSYAHSKSNMKVIIRKNETNLGCNFGVVKAIDWFFSNETKGIILEDDCVPTQEFFAFVNRYSSMLDSESRIGIITGQNPFTDIKEANAFSYIISSYPLIHGWYTNRSKWEILRKDFFNTRRKPKNFNNSKNYFRNFARVTYWHALRLRVKYGAVDTWDCFLVNRFFVNDFKSIVPPIQLIANIGNDGEGSHEKNPFLNINKTINLLFNEFDYYLEIMFYKISILRILTPYYKVTYDIIKDYLSSFENKQKFNNGIGE